MVLSYKNDVAASAVAVVVVGVGKGGGGQDSRSILDLSHWPAKVFPLPSLIRWDPSLLAWKIVNPARPAASFISAPVQMSADKAGAGKS